MPDPRWQPPTFWNKVAVAAAFVIAALLVFGAIDLLI